VATRVVDTISLDEGDQSGRTIHHEESKRPRRRPGRRRRASAWSNAREFIDALLMEPVDVVVGGERRRLKVIQAIILQLLRKQGHGDRRAQSLLLKYRMLTQKAAPEPQIVVKGGLPAPEFWNPDANRYE
jgi:hypothetical protein